MRNLDYLHNEGITNSKTNLPSDKQQIITQSSTSEGVRLKILKNTLGKPENDSLPWAIWIWNLNISKQEIKNQFQSFVSMGFGGIAIRPGKNMFPTYLSEEFFEHFEPLLLLAKANNIQIRIADDFSFSWNSHFNAIISQTKNLRAQQLILEKVFKISENEDLSLHIDNPFDTIILAVKLNGNQILLTDAKILTTKPDSGTVVWKAQQGEWKIIVFRKRYISALSEGYLPNVFNPNAAQAYIHSVLDPFKTHFPQHCPTPFCGFISELPAYRPGDNAIPWDDELIALFKTKFKKDLIKLLPALFFENCSQSQKFRQQFYSFLNESAHEQFTAPLEAWAKKNHLSNWVLHADKNITRGNNELIGELVSAQAESGAIGLQNIDGIHENLPILRLFSDSNTLERNQQIITVLGRNRSGLGGSPQSLKSEFDLSVLSCQSKILIDGFFFNVDPKNNVKSALNPALYTPEWVYMKQLCEYISRVNNLCKDIKWSRQVAVLSPLTELLSEYFPNNSEYSKKGFALFQKALTTLDRLNITYDCVSDSYLSSCDVRDEGGFSSNALTRSGLYRAIVIPFAPLISKSMLSFIEKAIQKEIKIFFIDEMPKGTIEDGITPAITGRILKMFDHKKNRITLIKSDLMESLFANNLQSTFSAMSNSRRDSDINVSWGNGDAYDLYILHNTSDSKDLQAKVCFPEHKHLSIADCETGEIFEIDHSKKDSQKSSLDIGFLPKGTFFLLGSDNKISTRTYLKHPKSGINPFSMQNKNYRIVLKDQWTFETPSLNSLPLGNWNVRIGFSRISGGFSHFYESNFQVKSLPLNCFLILNDPALVQLNHPSTDNEIELSVNGTRVEYTASKDLLLVKTESKTSTLETIGALPDTDFKNLFNDHSLTYIINKLLVKGNNRISIRTIGKAVLSQSMHLPPLLLGNFIISKDKNGLILDKPSGTVGYGSWTKYGYPYLSGKGIYRQFFDIPGEYKKIILRFSQVSGSIEIRLNEKNLGIFNWHPMEVDITSLVVPKSNDLVIGVLNTVDNVIRMNGRASGLIGEVFLDVY